jgi:membrane fusion protein (multidrug efflux system)
MSDDTALAPTRKTRLTRRMFLLVCVPVLVLLGALIAYLMGGRYVSTDNAYLVAQKVIVTPSVAGRVIAITVAEGQHVKPGDPLFRIDPTVYEIALAGAEAHLVETKTAFDTLRASFASLDRQIALAQQTLALRQADTDRKADLLASKAGSRTDADNAAVALSTARSALELLEEQRATTLIQLQDKPDLALEDYAPWREAKAAHDRARKDLDSTVVRASIEAIATQVPSIQLGRYLTPGTAVLALVEANRPWIVANPKETDLTYVMEGQAVTITVDAYPGRVWHGKVASLSPGTGAEFAILPPQNASGNWVKVVQRVPVRIEFSEGADLQALRSGMSAQVEIDTGHHHSLAGLLGWSAAAGDR